MAVTVGEVPTPERIAVAWQVAMATITKMHPGVEVNILATPNMAWEPGQPDWLLAAYVETGDMFGRQCDHLMAHLVSEPTPPTWVAHCGPAFQIILPPEAEATMVHSPEHGDLQERALAGDDEVREILSVTLVTLDSVILQAFSLPLIEPDSEPNVNGAVGGIIVDTLRLMLTTLHRDYS